MMPSSTLLKPLPVLRQNSTSLEGARPEQRVRHLFLGRGGVTDAGKGKVKAQLDVLEKGLFLNLTAVQTYS